MAEVSIVLPVYNEASILERSVQTVLDSIENAGYDFEILIAEDGSTDSSEMIASKMAQEHDKVGYLHSDTRLGKGGALEKAFREAKGGIVVHLDVDLSTDMRHLQELIDSIAKEGYDIAMGSRLMKDSKTKRPVKRDIASRGYNVLVRLLLGSRLHDHQCGFKAFKREVVLELANEVQDNHWFWDTEILVLAQRKGYKIKEFPVEWQQEQESKVKLRSDVFYMIRKILGMVFRN